MTALVAAVLVCTTAAPHAPTAGNPLVPPVLDVTFYFGGYADGFDAGRNGKLPIRIYT